MNFQNRNTAIFSRLFLLNILFLCAGNMLFYSELFDFALHLMLIGGLIFLVSLIINSFVKKELKLFFIGTIFSIIFTINGINNGLEGSTILFFIIGQLILILSISNIVISHSAIISVNNLMSSIIIINIILIYNEQLNFNVIDITNIWENPNTFAVSLLSPFFLYYATTKFKKKTIISFTRSITIITSFILIYFTSSRSALITISLGILLVNKPLVNKLSVRQLYFIYLSPVFIPIIAYIIYISEGGVQFMRNIGLHREVWIKTLEQYHNSDLSYNISYGLNSVIYGTNTYGIEYFLYIFVLGYFIYFKKKPLVTRGLILFSILHIHETFESTISSGSFGLIFLKAALLIIHNYEQNQIKNKYHNTNV